MVGTWGEEGAEVELVRAATCPQLYPQDSPRRRQVLKLKTEVRLLSFAMN